MIFLKLIYTLLGRGGLKQLKKLLVHSRILFKTYILVKDWHGEAFTMMLY